MENDKLKELRIKLDQLDDRIISKLKDRSRFLQNNSVYNIDGTNRGRKGISFLEFAIEGLEKYHESLGRFDYPEQNSLILPDKKNGLCEKNELIGFYKEFIKTLCSEGEDNSTFGETVYCDADIIGLINERINFGKYVAESKLQQNPSIFQDSKDSNLEKSLRNSRREEEVLEKARITSNKYSLNPACSEKFFRWVIDQTVRVQIRYLRMK